MTIRPSDPRTWRLEEHLYAIFVGLVLAGGGFAAYSLATSFVYLASEQPLLVVGMFVVPTGLWLLGTLALLVYGVIAS